MVRVLKFSTEGVGFDAWPGHEDSTLAQGTIQLCVCLTPGVQIGTNSSCVGKIAAGCLSCSGVKRYSESLHTTEAGNNQVE